MEKLGKISKAFGAFFRIIRIDIGARVLKTGHSVFLYPKLKKIAFHDDSAVLTLLNKPAPNGPGLNDAQFPYIYRFPSMDVTYEEPFKQPNHGVP